jgi:hypothetical protein
MSFVVVVFLLFYGCIVVISAEGVLDITGPMEAFEGEMIEFTVLLDGMPVQARVMFDAESTAKYSNGTTGGVTFLMPSVPYAGQWYTVSASLPSGSETVHYIHVKNRTGMLMVELPVESVVETNTFVVTVMESGSPVLDATVWFNSGIFQTNATGEVMLTAPDVLVTTNYGIIVNKTVYKSNTTMITIYEAGFGEQLFEIVSPYIVEPEAESIAVTIIGMAGGVADASLAVYYAGEQHSEYTTDATGTAYITAPSLQTFDEFSLFVAKEGYHTFDGENQHVIQLMSRGYSTDLSIDLSPSEVVEGDTVTVVVTDEVGNPVADAIVQREDVMVAETTDAEGVLVFIAPSVFLDREYYVYAVKDGYNFAEGRITIREGSVKTLQAVIAITVNENELFSVVVTDGNHVPQADALVTFNDEESSTDQNGSVFFIAPEVSRDRFYTVTMEKYGYLPASASIKVVDIDEPNGDLEQLSIHVQPRVTENEVFMATIKGEDGQPVVNAQVTFMGTMKETNAIGKVNFTASDVAWDETQDIRVSKSGYTSASTTIRIVNSDGFQFWFLVIAVVIILVIGIVAYFRYRQYMI